MSSIRFTSGFRPDIEGLRGVAILLVVACHAGLPGAGAGFIGVDVFFVLSGYLITGLLVDEQERTGRIALASFYARRARRILPAAAVVLVATLVAATIVMSPLDIRRVAQDGLAAGLSLANVRFALGATDYFSPTDPSPMLHYWSLSVEEQFYVFWPALVLVASRLRSGRLMLIVATGAVLVCSMALCVAITPENGNGAYFLLPTRAWQLAAGGVLALGMRRPLHVPWRIAALVGWVGVALIAGAMLLIGPTTPYPGIAAAVPTAGTLALIATGGAPGSPGRLMLRRRLIRGVGRISYSLYLWHWPVLVLGSVIVLGGVETQPTPIDLAVASAFLIAISVALAALTWRLVEEPFRAGRLSNGGRRRALALAVAAIMSVTVTSTALSNAAEREVAAASVDLQTPDDDDGWADEADPSDPGTPSDEDLRPTPSMAPQPASPTAEPASSPRPTPTPTPKPRPRARLKGSIPEGLRPSLAAARDDDDRLVRDGCALALGGTEPPDCVYGDRRGDFTVALVGDSHAMNWFPPLRRIAERRHWRLVPMTKYSCVFVDAPIWSEYLKREYTECEAWRERVILKLQRLKPDLVVISSNKWFATIRDRDGEPKHQGSALARYIEKMPGKVAIIVDTPRSDHDVPACLARNRTAIERCTTPKAAAFGWRHRIREAEARRLTGVPLIDMSKAICPTDPCPAIIGHWIVYRDHHHLTATFARSLAGDLDAAIAKVMGS